MNILDQYSNQDQQTYSPGEHQLVDTLESLAALAIIGWIIHRIITRGHYAAGIVMLVSSVAAFLVLINSNYGDNSFMVWLFWSLCAVAFLSLAKAVS